MLRKAVEVYIAILITSALAPCSTGAGLLEGSSSPNDPEAWSDSLVAMVRSLCNASGLGECAIPAVALEVAGPVTTTAATQRRIGRFVAAEGTIGRLMALARGLVRHYPGRPESHMVLSQAYFQVSKNAWKREDYPAIERALRQALESARHAASLDPRHEGARHLVDSLLPPLALFDAGRAKPR